jgi:hypothetical protein
VIQPVVWTREVPLYFRCGGIAAGSVLLSSTAVPVWSRSHRLLGPIFVATAAATGAAATRLTLALTSSPEATQTALRRVESGAMAAELALARFNEHRLGRLGEPLREGRSGRLFRARTGTAALARTPKPTERSDRRCACA